MASVAQRYDTEGDLRARLDSSTAQEAQNPGSWGTCPGCGAPELRKCSRRTCPEGSRRWSGDLRSVVVGTASQYPFLRNVVLTAPGADVLPWDRGRCGHEEGQCSGPVGCRVEDDALRAWVVVRQAEYGRLRRAAKLHLKRQGFEWPVVLEVWEAQLRGAPHLNMLVKPGAAADALVLYLERRREDYGFGYVDRKRYRKVWAGATAGRYVGCYVTGAGKSRGATIFALVEEWSSQRWWMVTRAVSAQWGLTMRAMRMGRQAWAWREGLGVAKPVAGLAYLDGKVVDLSTGEVRLDVWRGPPGGEPGT